MAINIFSGVSKGASRVNSASASSRAKAAKAALGGNAVASDSGATAVKTSGILGKTGDTIGQIAGIASKFLPGVAGTVASGLANLLNDPEWWQSVPGEQITLNTPLTIASAGVAQSEGVPVFNLRPALAEFTNFTGTTGDSFVVETLRPTPKMITQYLMPEIRKVVNAVPLQSAEAYSAVLAAHSTVYAAWRTLKKFDYLLKHGQTYLPNMNVAKFPVLQVDNAAWLQSTINRLEEYLRANVRIPHTLCEYLAWRYGRIYSSVDSAKAAMIVYNALPIDSSIEAWNDRLAVLMALPTKNEEYQKANADLYNAYYDHDLMVEIRDDTQFRYDPKEFALRTNCDIRTSGQNLGQIPVYLDSKLDNATAFMASTVSTRAKDENGDSTVLFPVSYLNIYTYSSQVFYHGKKGEVQAPHLALSAGWTKSTVFESVFFDGRDQDNNYLLMLGYLKACDIYNKNIYLPVFTATTSQGKSEFFDLTSVSYDCAITTDTVINNEQVFAFANLVNIDRRRSMSVHQAEKEVASEVANMVEKIDVATTATTPTK